MRDYELNVWTSIDCTRAKEIYDGARSGEEEFKNGNRILRAQRRGLDRCIPSLNARCSRMDEHRCTQGIEFVKHGVKSWIT
jgi:hypothetical protein